MREEQDRDRAKKGYMFKSVYNGPMNVLCETKIGGLGGVSAEEGVVGKGEKGGYGGTREN